MSYIPSSKMKHAHADQPAPQPADAPAAGGLSVPLWTSIAAGVVGAVGAAVLLSLRSSAPAPRKGRKKRKSADD